MKKKILFGFGVIAFATLVGASAISTSQNNGYKESKAVEVNPSTYYPIYDHNDNLLGSLGDSDNYYIVGSMILTYDYGQTSFTCDYLTYSVRGSNYALYCEDSNANIRQIMSNGAWQTRSILLTINSVSSYGEKVGEWFPYYFSDNPIGSTFTFNDQFNYNAFAQSGSQILENIQVREKSPFLAVGTLDTAVMTIEYEVGWFKSGDFAFDTIVARFDIATTDLIFEWLNGQSKSKLVEGHNPYKFFTFLSYKNSLSNFTLQVATRNKYLNSDSDTCINQNVSWLGSEYKTLHFYKVVDEQSYYYQVLTMANNNLVANGFNNGTTDVGLGGAFSLLATAFSSLSGILAISLFPGITLGLLLFLPLIVGIIIAIIWLIKK